MCSTLRTTALKQTPFSGRRHWKRRLRFQAVSRALLQMQQNRPPLIQPRRGLRGETGWHIKNSRVTGKEHQNLLVQCHFRKDFPGNTATREGQQMLKLPRVKAGNPLIEGSSPLRSGPNVTKSFQIGREEPSSMENTEGYRPFFVRWAVF